MKILVTGGAGFIGSHIADGYIKENHRVVIVDDLSTGNIKNLNPAADFIRMDIRAPELEGVFEKYQFDGINHHAAQINVRKSLEDPLYDADINIMGSLRLLQLSVRYGIKRFIFASSGGAVYGEPDKFPIKEEFPLNPLSPYGVGKIVTENYIRVFADLYGFEYVILRYSNVYGPRQISKSEAGVISIFINQILKDQKCYINGDGNQTRDYVYVDDVVMANLLALKCKSDTFNIGTGIETSVNSLIEILKEVVKRDIPFEHRPAIPGEVKRNVIDYTKAREILDWKPTFSLREGMKRTYNYFLQDGEKKEVS